MLDARRQPTYQAENKVFSRFLGGEFSSNVQKSPTVQQQTKRSEAKHSGRYWKSSRMLVLHLVSDQKVLGARLSSEAILVDFQ
jgi:hypothetical protein